MSKTARGGRAASVVAALAWTLASTACSKNDDRSAGQKLDAAIEKVEQKAGEAKVRAAEEADRARVRAGEVLKEAREAGGKAAQEAGGAVSDAVITAAVKAELARDPGLSALRIDVDTSNGRVVLRGSAPDDAARARATPLAAGVKGVSSVDNQLVTPAR